MLVNLTPHPMHIYAADTPDRIEPSQHAPIRVIEPDGQIARLGVNELGQFELDGLRVAQIEHHGNTGLPEYAGHMDSRDRDVWYIVSLVTALASPSRGDLLVPYAEVRNMSGQTIGCRMLGRPV